jgi:WXXGXW repeat (2 copies)
MMQIKHPLRALGLLVAMLALPLLAPAQISVGLSINIAPPMLPVYVQPPVPGPDYLWAPGYWAWGPDGYYWVPGTWVLAPTPGFLWTPGYWGWGGGVYLWHAGYWGPHVGFYGGVNYGFGFGGHGYEGGYWNGGHFFYNTAVVNVGGAAQVGFTYSRPVMAGEVVRTSFNGGPGGVTAQPNAEEQQAARESHVPATPMQLRHETRASTQHNQLASVNHGAPQMAATTRASQFANPQRSQRNAMRPGPGPRPGSVPGPRSQPQPGPRNQPRAPTGGQAGRVPPRPSHAPKPENEQHGR